MNRNLIRLLKSVAYSTKCYLLRFQCSKQTNVNKSPAIFGMKGCEIRLNNLPKKSEKSLFWKVKPGTASNFFLLTAIIKSFEVIFMCHNKIESMWTLKLKIWEGSFQFQAAFVKVRHTKPLIQKLSKTNKHCQIWNHWTKEFKCQI